MAMQESFFDFHGQEIPIIESGQSPPTGPYATWATRHGPALCIWHAGGLQPSGGPSWADNVLMPDGSRGRAQYMILAPTRAWRREHRERNSNLNRWIFGAVEFSDTDGVFTDLAPQPVPTAPIEWGYPDLECELWNSAEIRSQCQDRGSAMALFLALEHRHWRHKSGAPWHCTLRGGGAIVASLRNRGEIYLDYYGRGDRRIAAGHEQEVDAAIAVLGWRAISSEQFHSIQTDMKEVLTALENERTARSRPAWYKDLLPQNRVASTIAGWILRRIHGLAESGRVSEQEWKMLFARLHGEISAERRLD